MEERERIAVWVGLDWGDEEHAWALLQADSQRIESGSVRQRPEDFQAWLAGLRERAGGGWVAVAVEQSRGAVLYALMDYDFVLIYPVHPKSLSDYRKALYPGGAKDDARDADLLLDYLLKHRDKLRLWEPESPQVRCLRMLSEQRRRMVDRRTALTNQLTANLKQYFPQALDWAGALKEVKALDFLERWPTLAAVQKARARAIRSFFVERGEKADEALERKIGEISGACALTRDWAILTAGSMQTQGLAREIRQLNESIHAFDLKIGELFEGHDDHVIFTSLPGAGKTLGPRLLALLGDRRERFDSAQEVQRVSGIAPVTRASGKTQTVHCRWACPRFVRQSAHEFAAMSVRHCAWAGAYYRMRRDKGALHHVAVRSLAYKWLRILYRCWKDGEPYDDARYMASLRANNAPLLGYLE